MPRFHFVFGICLILAGWSAAAMGQTMLTIPQIQGAGHTSPYNNTSVQTSGVITAKASNGFYFQDPVGDGDDATSDGLFVFTSSAPASFSVGDSVQVVGNVSEFLPASANLRVTQLTASLANVLKTGTGALMPSVIGATGRMPPTSVIDDDSFAVFDPASDGIDFYESLEGMLVQLPNAVATSPRNSFGEIWAVPDNGTTATGMNSRGGITISAADFNPERLQIDDGVGVSTPGVLMGDGLGHVTGVINYGFGNYELLVTAPIVRQAIELSVEQSALIGRRNRLTVASYNVENLHPFNDVAKFDAHAQHIVGSLNAPDIIALQEVQDNSGPTDNGVTSASDTYNTLIASIQDLGGPVYEFAEIAPPGPNIDGGQMGGNIRVGYLYNPDRVDLKPGSLVRHGDFNTAFINSRKPLEVTFDFNGHEVVLINNHFASKGGGTPLLGSIQPPSDGGLNSRNGQAAFVNELVDDILAVNPDARIVVLGDLNSFSFEQPHALLTVGPIDPVLFNLNELLDPNERYSYNFEGNSQQLDHIYVSAALLTQAQFDAVHVNTGFADPYSDHDPLLASFLIPVPEPAAAVQLSVSAICVALGLKRRATRFSKR